MLRRRSGWSALLVVLAACYGWGAESDLPFREARQSFQAQMRKKSPIERVAAVTDFAKFPSKETADLLVKRALLDADPEVRQITQAALRDLVAADDIQKSLFDELKRAFRKAVITDTARELLRSFVVLDDEEQRAEIVAMLDEYLASPRCDLLVPISMIDEFAKQGDADALRAVTCFAKSKAFNANFGYRRTVVQAMIKIPLREAVTELILTLPQTQGLIQYDIVQYLTKLTSQKFGDNDRQWYQWWKENREGFDFPKIPLPLAEVQLNDGKPTYYGLPVCAKRIVFVLDTSGSMRGQPLITAKSTLISVLEKLPPAVNFNVVMFDKTATVWQPRLMPATTQAKTEVISLIRNRGMGNGTASFAALEAAFGLEPEAIYFLSDGRPTDSQPDQIYNTLYGLNRTRRVSVYTFGLATQRNAADLILFMKPLAEQNFATFRIVE